MTLVAPCTDLTPAALEGRLFGPVSWPERMLLLLAAGGFVALSGPVALAAAVLALLVVGWQVIRSGRRWP